MQDHYPEAAVRHYIDGKLLHENNRYDNAMCHYAFSAECAIKALIDQLRQIYPAILNRPRHEVLEDWQSITDYHDLLGVLYPQISMLGGLGTPPAILFDGHPQRRYWNDKNYTSASLTACGEFVSQLSAWIISAAIDGKLQYDMELDV